MDIDVVDARDERTGLLNRDGLEASIGQANLEAVVASSLFNVTYTSGCLMVDEPLPTFVVTATGGKQGLVINEADARYFRQHSQIADIRDYRFQSTTSASIREAVARLAGLLDDMGLGRGRIGFELDSLPASVYLQLTRETKASVSDAGAVFERARLIKTAGEIELLRAAATRTEEAIRSAFERSRSGDTEAQLTAAIQSGLLQAGASGLAHARALAGVHSTVAHAWPSTKRIAEGEVIHVDFGGYFAGYCSDIGRNAVVGQPTERQDTIYRKLHEICTEMVSAVRPGLTAGELYAIGDKAMTTAGLVYPWGTYGHNIGLSGHEGYEITRDSPEVLQAGMVLNLEPSHIETQDARYQVEETVAVTESGSELLSGTWSPSRLTPIGNHVLREA